MSHKTLYPTVILLAVVLSMILAACGGQVTANPIRPTKTPNPVSTPTMAPAQPIDADAKVLKLSGDFNANLVVGRCSDGPLEVTLPTGGQITAVYDFVDKELLSSHPAYKIGDLVQIPADSPFGEILQLGNAQQALGSRVSVMGIWMDRDTPGNSISKVIDISWPGGGTRIKATCPRASRELYLDSHGSDILSGGQQPMQQNKPAMPDNACTSTNGPADDKTKHEGADIQIDYGSLLRNFHCGKAGWEETAFDEGVQISLSTDQEAQLMDATVEKLRQRNMNPPKTGLEWKNWADQNSCSSTLYLEGDVLMYCDSQAGVSIELPMCKYLPDGTKFFAPVGKKITYESKGIQQDFMCEQVIDSASWHTTGSAKPLN